MKSSYRWLCFVTIILIFPARLLSQQKDSADKKTSYGQIGIKYLSNNVYLGRKDSTVVPYITPSLSYYNKAGFYITGSFSWLPVAGQSRIDVIAIEGGYDFSIKDKFDGGLYAGKYFYNSGSYAVNAAIGTGIGLYGDYNFGPISFNSGLSVDLGDNTDFVVEGGLSHSFSSANDKLEITPGAKFNAGTQNYYNNYYKSGHAAASGAAGHGHGRGRGNSNPPVPSTTTTTYILEASQFKLLDFEFSLPVNYTANKFKFSFTPTYVIPVNPATLAVDQTLVKEKLSSSFIAQLEITYRLGK